MHRDITWRAGVYIINNAVNGLVYVGSTTRSFRQRWGDHKKMLRGHVHKNARLQRAWNEHGEDSFEFDVLEVCPPTKRCVEREQFHIDSLRSHNPAFGYNLNPVAGSVLGSKRSEETCRKFRKLRLAEAARRRGKKLSSELRADMAERVTRWAAERRLIRLREVKQSPSDAITMAETHLKKERRKNLLITDEARKKMSLATKGKPKSEAHKLAIGAANRRYRELNPGAHSRRLQIVKAKDPEKWKARYAERGRLRREHCARKRAELGVKYTDREVKEMNRRRILDGKPSLNREYGCISEDHPLATATPSQLRELGFQKRLRY